MRRLGFATICGVLALVTAEASAQHRPAAWDTRVMRSPAVPAAPQEDKSVPESKDKTKKTFDAAGDKKDTKPKAN